MINKRWKVKWIIECTESPRCINVYFSLYRKAIYFFANDEIQNHVIFSIIVVLAYYIKSSMTLMTISNYFTCTRCFKIKTKQNDYILWYNILLGVVGFPYSKRLCLVYNNENDKLILNKSLIISKQSYGGWSNFSFNLIQITLIQKFLKSRKDIFWKVTKLVFLFPTILKVKSS